MTEPTKEEKVEALTNSWNTALSIRSKLTPWGVNTKGITRDIEVLSYLIEQEASK